MRECPNAKVDLNLFCRCAGDWHAGRIHHCWFKVFNRLGKAVFVLRVRESGSTASHVFLFSSVLQGPVPPEAESSLWQEGSHAKAPDWWSHVIGQGESTRVGSPMAPHLITACVRALVRSSLGYRGSRVRVLILFLPGCGACVHACVWSTAATEATGCES